MNLNIQFMRGLAALMVLFYHTALHYFIVTNGEGAHTVNIFSIMEKFGYAGVDIFFVISGYIMWLTTQKLNYGSKKNSLIFLYKRLTRIYSGYWVFFILVTVGYYILGKDMSNVDLVSSFFLTSAAIDKLLIPVSWTLTFELYFYVAFSLLLIFSKKVRIVAVKILFLIIFLTQLYIYFIAPEYKLKQIFSFFLSPFTLEFIIGIFIAMFFEKKRIQYISVPFILLIIFFGLGLYYQEYILQKTLVEGYTSHERVLFFGSTAALGVAIMSELYYRKIMVFPRFSHLFGDSSYSIYLSHTIILMGLYFIGVRNWILEYGELQMVFMFLVVGIILLYGVLHYRYIELPLINVSKKYKLKIEKLLSST